MANDRWLWSRQASRPTFSHDSACTRTGFGSSSSGQALISPGAGRRFPVGHYRRPDFQVVRVASWVLGLGDVQLLCDDGLLVWPGPGLGRSDEMLKATAVRNSNNDQGEEMARSRPVASGRGRHRPFSLDPHLTPPPLQWLAPRAWIGDFSHGVSELAADGRATLLATSSMSFLLPPRTADGGRRHDSVSNVTGPQPVAIGHPDSCAAGLDAGKRRIRHPATIGPCSRLSDGLWKRDQGPHGGPAWDWRSDGDGTAWVRSGRRSFFMSA